MATKAQLEEALKNPNVQKLLAYIRKSEVGTTDPKGYYTTFGHGKLSNLSSHPNQFWGKTKDGPTSATGGYQFIRKTWNGLQKQYGLSDFGPRNQDIAALALIAQDGALNDALSGNFESAVNKIGSTWQGVFSGRSPNQPKGKKSDFYAFFNGKGGQTNYESQPASDYVQQAKLGLQVGNETILPENPTEEKLFEDIKGLNTTPDNEIKLASLGNLIGQHHKSLNPDPGIGKILFDDPPKTELDIFDDQLLDIIDKTPLNQGQDI